MIDRDPDELGEVAFAAGAIVAVFLLLSIVSVALERCAEQAAAENGSGRPVATRETTR